MKTAHIYSPGYALLAGLLLTAGTGAQAVDNNLHFYGNLLSKSCTWWWMVPTWQKSIFPPSATGI